MDGMVGGGFQVNHNETLCYLILLDTMESGSLFHYRSLHSPCSVVVSVALGHMETGYGPHTLKF